MVRWLLHLLYARGSPPLLRSLRVSAYSPFLMLIRLALTANKICRCAFFLGI